ncbi:MAG TPA: hypothetical protein VN048_16460 [Verrucomicrobiae bacterium]|jgi:hypothetical protein|nr:hypothetical protein [Verrucomicrobiae bacterium]
MHFTNNDKTSGSRARERSFSARLFACAMPLIARFRRGGLPVGRGLDQHGPAQRFSRLKVNFQRLFGLLFHGRSMAGWSEKTSLYRIWWKDGTSRLVSFPQKVWHEDGASDFAAIIKL